MQNPRFTNDIGGIVITQDDGVDLYVDDKDLYQRIVAGEYGVIQPYISDEDYDSAQAAEVRTERDYLLALTDWTQAADIPQATKEKWAPYRQALRDVPAQSGFPAEIVWPVKPA